MDPSVDRKPRVFISFHNSDDELKRSLVKHLQHLVPGVLSEVWCARDVQAGAEWQREVDAHIERADIAIVLVSVDYLALDSSLREMQKLRRLHKEKGLKVIPVLLRACSWRDVPWLCDLKILPSEEHPISSLEGNAREQAWTEVVDEIKRCIPKAPSEPEPKDDGRTIEPDLEMPPKASTSRAMWWLSGLIVLLVFGAAAALFASGMRERRYWEVARTVVDGAQLVALIPIFVVVWSFDDSKVEKNKEGADEQAKPSIRQFVVYWQNLWLVWLVFYGLHTARELLELRFEPYLGSAIKHWVPVMNLGTSLLHNHQSATLLMLFWIMIRPTLDAKGRSRPVVRWNTPIWIACLSFLAVQALLLAWFHESNDYVLLADLGAALVSGVTAATCMGIFVGRLESRFLDVHPAELVALYAYAGTQALFPVFRALRVLPWSPDCLPPLIEMLLKGLALALKLGLFFVVHRQISSGRLTFYMHRVRLLREAVQDDWEDFRRTRLR